MLNLLPISQMGKRLSKRSAPRRGVSFMRGNKSQYKYALARQFRRALTPPEVRLWARLKGKADGLHFRKQHPVGPYIVDFYCPKAKMIIEVDGLVHDAVDVAAKDQRRSDWLFGFGLEILRVTASEVMADPDDVTLGIIAYARSRLRSDPSVADCVLTDFAAAPPHLGNGEENCCSSLIPALP